MRARSLTSTLAATAAIAGAGALALGTGAAPGQPAAAYAPKKITPTGVGKVRLGRTHAELRADGVVGRLRRGCELGGPDTRSANLKAPLKGFVTYTLTAPRTVTAITILGGARARGVGIGATIPQIRDAFPKAKVNRGTEEVFGVTLVRIPKNGGGRFVFLVDVDSEKTERIAIPRPAFCE